MITDSHRRESTQARTHKLKRKENQPFAFIKKIFFEAISVGEINHSMTMLLLEMDLLDLTRSEETDVVRNYF